MLLTPIEEVKLLVDLLDRLGITPLHLHVDTRTATPKANVSLASRSDFERFVEAAGVPSVERPARVSGQREWFAEADTPGWEILVQAVSFVHHHDWKPRPEVAGSG